MSKQQPAEQTNRMKPGKSDVVLAVMFTLIQVWAIITVVTDVQVHGVVRVALALALTGTIMAVMDAWRDSRAPTERQPKASEADQQVGVAHDTHL